MNRPEHTPTRPAARPAHPAHPPHPITPAELRKAEHLRRGVLEEAWEGILATLAAPDETGPGNTWEELRAASKLTDAELVYALQQLEEQGFVERATRGEGVLIWLPRAVPATQRIIIPDEALVPAK